VSLSEALVCCCVVGIVEEVLLAELLSSPRMTLDQETLSSGQYHGLAQKYESREEGWVGGAWQPSW